VLEESEALTETEERYLALLELKRKIKKAEKNVNDPEQERGLVQKLKGELEDLKRRQV